jgi:hypothetical protein
VTADVVLENLVYPIGALVLIIIGTLIVTLRHRKPKSVEANMASFNKGLRALAPETGPATVSRPPSRVPQPTTIRTVSTATPGGAASGTVLSDTVLSDTVLSDPVLSDTVLSDPAGVAPPAGTTTEAEAG